MKVCGTPNGPPDGQPFEHREALAELEAGGAVVRVVAGDAAVDQEPAQRHHEGLHAHLGDEEAVDGAEPSAGQHHDEDGERPVHAGG